MAVRRDGSNSNMLWGVSEPPYTDWKFEEEDFRIGGPDFISLPDGRILLAEKGEIAYSAALGTCDWAQELTEEDLTVMFHFIYMDWNSGET